MKVVRLSVNLNEETAAKLKHLADSQGVTLTEAVRRAVSVYAILSEARINDEKVQLVGHGRVKELVIA